MGRGSFIRYPSRFRASTGSRMRIHASETAKGSAAPKTGLLDRSFPAKAGNPVATFCCQKVAPKPAASCFRGNRPKPELSGCRKIRPFQPPVPGARTLSDSFSAPSKVRPLKKRNLWAAEPLAASKAFPRPAKSRFYGRGLKKPVLWAAGTSQVSGPVPRFDRQSYADSRFGNR